MSLNPLPFRVGGGPSNTSKAYTVIRGAVGTGGSARNDRGIEGLWRRSKAHGLAASTSPYRRALLQLNPALATDFLPYYERILGLVAAPEDAEATRAAAAALLWTRSIDALLSSITDELARIDGRLSVLLPNPDHAATAQHGRAFDGHDATVEGPPFGGERYALYPNYSTHFIVHVRFAIGHSGPYTAFEERVVERVKAFMRDVLPSWVDFRISVGAWHLGHTPLNMGALA